MNNNSFKIQTKQSIIVKNVVVDNMSINNNSTQYPSTGVVYNDGGFLMFKGADGTITVIANK
jgi:hypothetical protein